MLHLIFLVVVVLLKLVKGVVKGMVGVEAQPGLRKVFIVRGGVHIDVRHDNGKHARVRCGGVTSGCHKVMVLGSRLAYVKGREGRDEQESEP